MKKGELLDRMLVIATNTRGGNPYILHPLKVMHYVN